MKAIGRDWAQAARHWRGAISEGSPIANHGAEVRSSAGGIAVRLSDRGENIRTMVLRGLLSVGIKVSESELTDRRGRRRKD